MENEIWKPVKNYELYYEVSNYGRVRSLDRLANGKHGAGTMPLKGRILRQRCGKFGYMYVVFSVDSQRKTLKVHRLVAGEFCIKPVNMNVVNHVDSNKSNNFYKNLEWTDRDGNVAH